MFPGAATISLGAAIAWRRPTPAAVSASAQDAAVAEREIVLGAGFEPRTTVVPCGVPVRLAFRRAGPTGCDAVAVPSLGRLATFPADGAAVIELGPLNPGEHLLVCSGAGARGVLAVAPRAG